MHKIREKCFLNYKNVINRITTTTKYVSTNIQELDTVYDPQKLEALHDKSSWYFKATVKNTKPFTMILPPPNVTGTLHLGHALTITIQDVLIRWKQMQGIETMWVPGIDHAGIATQVVVEKKLWNEKRKTRHDIGRQAFLEEVWQWKKDKGNIIGDELRQLHASLNWEEENFTMDPKHTRAVEQAFIDLFDAELIYRADYLVNWSCILRSAISDIEVEHIEIDGPTRVAVPGYEKPIEFGKLFKFAYKLEGKDDEEIIVATTRPETILGDVAVAVRGDDERYRKFVGRRLWHPFRNEWIPVIADDFVDPKFGTGAVKITPAHDLADFQAGQRHSLDMLQVINELGQISEINKELQGMPRFQARDVVIDRLQTMGLFRGSENHKMLLPLCSRSKDVVELLMRPQWFIKCNEMATRALKSVEEEMLSIQPKDFEKNWKNWMGNIRDWCISRQLWWGHQIPAYCCTNENNPQEQIWVAARNDNEAKLKASVKLGVNEDKITCTRDEDVLDTWFSSSLQPFATFGWPNKTEKLTKYYPLSLMETGHDILLFWVARMVMLGVQLTGELPFNEILLHGIICDPQGRKMSKSLGNVVSPDDVIRGVSLELMEKRVNESHKKGLISSVELKRAIRGQKTMFPQGIPECGSDALRFTLLSHNVKNHFIKFEVSECHTNRLFCNKIWQATKFTKIWCKAVSEKQEIQTVETNQFSVTDKWILSRLTKLVDNVNTALDCYDFHVAVASLKDFLYYDFCDVYLETIKRELQSSESSTAATHCWVLTKCLDVGLRCLGPFMPVLSQHLHKSLPILDDTGNSLEFPKALKWRDEQLEKDFEELLRIITSLRRLKKIFNISKKHEPQAYLISNWSFLEQMSDIVSDLSACSSVHVSKNKFDSDILKGCVTDSLGETTIFLTVHEEVMKNLKVDLPNMQKKRMKLVHELDKLMTLASTEKNKLKIHSDAEVTLSKKILVVKEKIARIDCINSFIRN